MKLIQWKHLGIRAYNTKLTENPIMTTLHFKLIRTNGMLYKARDYINAGILKSIYHALFELHIRYACIIWGCIRNQSSFDTSKENIKIDLL